MNKKFSELPIGAEFEFFGVRYRKTALSVGEDADHRAHVFRCDYEVEPVTDLEQDERKD